MRPVETIDMADRLYSVHRLQIKKLDRDVDFMYKDFIPMLFTIKMEQRNTLGLYESKFFREMIARLGGQ